MQTSKVVSQENQSEMIQNYVIGSSAFLYNDRSPLNCGSPGLFAREVNNKTFVDTETSLIRGQISQPIIQEPTLNSSAPNNVNTENNRMKPDIGITTRLKRPTTPYRASPSTDSNR